LDRANNPGVTVTARRNHAACMRVDFAQQRCEPFVRRACGASAPSSSNRRQQIAARFRRSGSSPCWLFIRRRLR